MEYLKFDHGYWKCWMEYRELINKKKPDKHDSDWAIKYKPIHTDPESVAFHRFSSLAYKDLEASENMDRMVVHFDDKVGDEYDWYHIHPNDLNLERMKEDDGHADE